MTPEKNGPTIITIKVNAKEIFDKEITTVSLAQLLTEANSTGIPDIKDYCCIKDNQTNTTYVCNGGIGNFTSEIFEDSFVMWKGMLEPNQKSEYGLELDLAIVNRESSNFFDKIIFPGSGTHIIAFTKDHFVKSPDEAYVVLLSVTHKATSVRKTFVLDPILKGLYK
jgi:hypothetical protein